MFSNYINEANNKNRFSDIIKFVKYNKSLNNYNKNEIINYLTKLKQHKTISFCNDSLLEEIIYIFSNDSNEKLMFTEFLNISQYMYRYNLVSENNELERNNYLELFKLVINYYISIKKTQDNKDFKITNIEYISDIYNFFENKNNAKMIITKIIQNQIGSNTILKAIYSCMSKTYSYYTDEFTYTRIMFNIIDELSSLDVDNLKKIDDYIHNQLNLTQKQAGIYDVDEEKIKELENKINELKNKLDGIEKNAEKNSDYYAQIELETKILLGDMEKFKTIKPPKSYKIVNKLEANRKKLLYNIKIRNNNFNLQTTDTRWFCKEVIDKLGIEYIANSNCRQQESIDIAYQNNQIETFCEILKINPKFILYIPILFNNEFIEVLGLNTIANVFTTCESQALIVKLYNNNEIAILKKILELNPNYNLSETYINEYIISKKVIEQFNIEYIANCSNKIKHTIFYFCMANELPKLVDIFKIKPNFYIDCELLKNNIKYFQSRIDEEICTLIQNLNITEIIDFFDLENKIFFNFHEIISDVYCVEDNECQYTDVISKFLNLSPEYRKKVLNIKVDNYKYSEYKYIEIYRLFKQIVKQNDAKLKFKSLIKIKK